MAAYQISSRHQWRGGGLEKLRDTGKQGGQLRRGFARRLDHEPAGRCPPHFQTGNEALDFSRGGDRLTHRCITRFVSGGHHRVDLALGGFILRSGESSGGLYGRDDALDAGEEASGALEYYLVGCPIKESGKERLLRSNDVCDA
jgi:hypothetical protein